MRIHHRGLQSLNLLRRHCQHNITPHTIMTLKTGHEDRTAADHREPGLHTVLLNKIEQPHSHIRLLLLRPLGEKPKARDLIR